MPFSDATVSSKSTLVMLVADYSLLSRLQATGESSILRCIAHHLIEGTITDLSIYLVSQPFPRL
jgi:hypothetical protein